MHTVRKVIYSVCDYSNEISANCIFKVNEVVLHLANKCNKLV